ncbi:MAG: hypothetical protein KOO69_07060, partial [Victivallales bacterium]|nr:hypothetical protein [Victivallales bacterium]
AGGRKRFPRKGKGGSRGGGSDGGSRGGNKQGGNKSRGGGGGKDHRPGDFKKKSRDFSKSKPKKRQQ